MSSFQPPILAEKVTITIPEIQTLLEAVYGEIQGTDSEDKDYNSIIELWNQELVPSKDGQKLTWYSKAFKYWESEANCPITDDGVLGGYGKLTPMDVIGSNKFLDQIFAIRPSLKFHRAADCGAGIGRVTKHFLLSRFEHVDLVEQSPRLLASSIDYIGADATRTSRIEVGLQDFNPPPNTYDVIWIQWVIGHLHDLDFIDFFRRCARGLTESGVIILKDNCCTPEWAFVLDCQDRSVARCDSYIQLLLQLAGMQLLLVKQQENFPSELYPVNMYAIVPLTSMP